VRGPLLWLDDDAGVNRFAERLLRDRGFDVDIVLDRAGALSALARTSYGAMVVDLRLQEESGLRVLREARSLGCTTPAIILTGFGSVASAVEALTLGVGDYQLKPARPARIVAAIRIALRAGRCQLPSRPLALAPYSDASLPLLSVLFNLEHADEYQLRTQLAWAAADEVLSFAELVGAVESLRHLLETPREPETEARAHVGSWLRRALGAPSSLGPEVQEFIRLIITDRVRVRNLTDDAVADEVGVTLAQLSRLVYAQIGLAPERCRLIAHMQPGLQQLAHSNEQVAQIGYRLGHEHPSAFDREFRKLWGVTPTEYRSLLTGLVTEF
jgi:two-component system response regulator RegA